MNPKIKNFELKIRAKITPVRETILGHIKSDFFRNPSTQLLLIPSVALLVAVWVLSLYYFRSSSYIVPTRYSSFLGVVSLGQWYDSYQIAVFLTLCYVINLFLAKVIYSKDKFLGYVLASGNIFLAIIAIVLVINFGRLVGN